MSEVFIVYGQPKRKWWFGYSYPRVYKLCTTRARAKQVIVEFAVAKSTSRLYIVPHLVETIT